MHVKEEPPFAEDALKALTRREELEEGEDAVFFARPLSDAAVSVSTGR